MDQGGGRSWRVLSEENGGERTLELDHYFALYSVIILRRSGIGGEELVYKI
jgi:hypothetical protein